MKYGHFEMCRLNLNRKLDEKRMFAVWRVDPPWKSVTKKGLGHRMGSGLLLVIYFSIWESP